MANERPTLELASASFTHSKAGATTELGNQHTVVVGTGTSKVLVHQTSFPTTHGNRDLYVQTSENYSLVVSGQPVAHLECSGQVVKHSTDANQHTVVVSAGTSKVLVHQASYPTTDANYRRTAVVSTDTSKIPLHQASSPTSDGKRELDVRTSKNRSLVVSEHPVARLECSGQAMKHSTDVNVRAAQVEEDNTVKVQAAVVKTTEGLGFHQSVEATDEGELVVQQRAEYEKRTYIHIIEIMYKAALDEPENPENVKPTKKEKCIDFCCRACTCNFRSVAKAFGRRQLDAPPAAPKVDVHNMTPRLRRGRAKGWDMHSEIIFPLMSDAVREITVSVEFIILIIAFCFSVATFSLGKDKEFNIVHLVLTIIGSLLAFVDAVVSLSGCKICRACCCHKARKERKKEEAIAQSEMTASNAEAGQSEEEKPGRCRKCLNATKTKLDFARMILAEVILFPLLICDIFELIIGESYKFENVADGISFVLFVISILSLVFYVYIMRLAILAGTIFYTQKERKPKTAQGRPSENGGFDFENSKSAFYFQGYFFYHVLMQMIAQILMIVAIAARIRYDNRHMFNKDDMNMEDNMNMGDNTNMDEGIRVSNYLWYMLVGGYVLPVAGLFTFFIVTYYWVQEFPIGLCIDLFSLLQMPGMENVVNYKEGAKEYANKMEKIMQFVNLTELKKDFCELRQRRWLDDKFLYSFKSPVMVILCMSYTALQMAFVICAAVESDSGQLNINPLDGDPWVGIYVVSVFIGGIANIYVFTVALFWMGVIIFILLAIAVLIMLIGLLCLIFCLASSSDNNKPRH